MKFDEVNLDIIKESKILHVGSLSLTNNPSRMTTLSIIEYAKKNNVLISYDPNYRESLWNGQEEAIIQMKSIIPDIFKISEEEIELLTNEKEYCKAAEILLDRGSKIVVVTLGVKGCYIAIKGENALVKGFSSDVIDTTGAGDSFWGAFLSKIIYEDINKVDIEKLNEICVFANATASLCIESVGAIPSMPSLEDVKKRITSLKSVN